MQNKRKGGSKVREREGQNGLRSRPNPVSTFSSDGGGISLQKERYTKEEALAGGRLGGRAFVHQDQEFAIEAFPAPIPLVGTGRPRRTTTMRVTRDLATGIGIGTTRTTIPRFALFGVGFPFPIHFIETV